MTTFRHRYATTAVRRLVPAPHGGSVMGELIVTTDLRPTDHEELEELEMAIVFHLRRHRIDAGAIIVEA